jgi:hypothetical protein
VIYDVAMTSPAASTTPDFTVTVEPIVFRCDGVEYKAPRTIHPLNLKSMLAAASKVNFDDTAYLMEHFEEVTPLMQQVLRSLVPGKGGEHLAARMAAPILSEDELEANPDAMRPLDLIRQALPIMTYLLEELGLRPTTPSSVSSDGSMADTTGTPSDGTSSTDGHSLMESDSAS